MLQKAGVKKIHSNTENSILKNFKENTLKECGILLRTEYELKSKNKANGIYILKVKLEKGYIQKDETEVNVKFYTGDYYKDGYFDWEWDVKVSKEFRENIIKKWRDYQNEKM